MIKKRKQIYFATLGIALILSSFCTPAFCDEKINAGVVYEFYLDVENSIIEIPDLYKKLPKINDADVNEAYYKDFRPLNMLSLAHAYSIKPKNLSPNYQKRENIPAQYDISFKSQNIAAAAKIAPNQDELYTDAIKLKTLEKYQEALDKVNLALKNNPNYAPGHFLKGDILRLLGKYKDSVLEYLAAINLDPYCTDAYFNIAKIFESTNQKDLALDYYRYAYTTNPRDYEIKNIILNMEKQRIN